FVISTVVVILQYQITTFVMNIVLIVLRIKVIRFIIILFFGVIKNVKS
ncbi:uncharacterized protein METZ01_LOCUS453528, partial [marine metagenome]